MTIEHIALLYAVILGMCVGSFLNVVHHRLPLMLAQRRGDAGVPAAGTEPTITLSKPASRCPVCGHRIKWYENIPVLSYLLLRGRCSGCGAAISARYPLVELGVGIGYGLIIYWIPGWVAQALTVTAFTILATLLGLTNKHPRKG